MDSMTPHMKNELDRHITGDCGEDQVQELTECPVCESMGELDVYAELRLCKRCDGEGYLKKEGTVDPGDDPDRKYDEERDRRMLGIGRPDEIGDECADDVFHPTDSCSVEEASK